MEGTNTILSMATHSLDSLNNGTLPEPSVAPQSVEFRLAVQFRRCAWYAFIGGLLMGTLQVTLVWLGMVPAAALDGRQYVIFGIFFIPSVLLIATTELWRLRIDSQGLSRRRLLWWSTWSWNAFHEGQIHLNSVTKRIRFPERPWWDRELLLEYLEDGDRQTIATLCNLAAVEASPVAPLNLESLTAVGWGEQAKISREGIEWKRRGEIEIVPWLQVHGLRLEWEQHEKKCFGYLELIRPGQNLIRLRVIRFRRQIAGSSGTLVTDEIESVESFLAEFISREAWESLQSFTEPRTKAEADFQLIYWTQREKYLRRVLFWLAILIVAASVLFLVLIGVPKLIEVCRDPFLPLSWKIVMAICMLLTTTMQPFMVIALSYSLWARLRRKIQQLIAWEPPLLRS